MVIHCNAYFAAWVKLWETPALSSQQDGVAVALGPAFEREGNRESCQKVREWEFETEWDSEQAFIYATIFNPTPSRLSQAFLSRTLRKQAWLGFLSARWAVQSQSGKDSTVMTRHWLKRKKELKSWHIFAWLVVSGASDCLKGSLTCFSSLKLIMNLNWKHLCLILPLTVFISPLTVFPNVFVSCIAKSPSESTSTILKCYTMITIWSKLFYIYIYRSPLYYIYITYTNMHYILA